MKKNLTSKLAMSLYNSTDNGLKLLTPLRAQNLLPSVLTQTLQSTERVQSSHSNAYNHIWYWETIMKILTPCLGTIIPLHIRNSGNWSKKQRERNMIVEFPKLLNFDIPNV